MPTDASGVRREQAAQGIEQRCFATAGWADNTDDLSLPERQAEIANNRYDGPADLIAFCNVLYDQRRDRTTSDCGLRILSVSTGARSHHFRLATAFSANELSMIWSNGMLPLALPR